MALMTESAFILCDDCLGGQRIRSKCALDTPLVIQCSKLRPSAKCCLCARSTTGARAPTSLRAAAVQGGAGWADSSHSAICPCANRRTLIDHLRRGALPIGLWGVGRWRECDRRFAPEASKGVELLTILARLAAQHRDPAERTMLNARSRLGGHCRKERSASLPSFLVCKSPQ